MFSTGEHSPRRLLFVAVYLGVRHQYAAAVPILLACMQNRAERGTTRRKSTQLNIVFEPNGQPVPVL